MRVNEPIKTSKGWLTKVLPLYKWRRKDGLASFLVDRIALRKTLSLCNGCLVKMPRAWQARYNYERVLGFHTDDCGCDYCRETTSTTLYVAAEGDYHAEWEATHTSVAATVKRDRTSYNKDSRLVVPL